MECFATARQSSNQRQAQRYKLEKALAIIKKWIKQGRPNVSHYNALLEAELAALQGRVVFISARSGLLLDTGAAAERLGQFLLEIGESRKDAPFQLKRAIEYYNGCGAFGKSTQMEKKDASSLWPLPEQVCGWTA